MQNFPIQTFNGHCYALKTGLEHITYHVPITLAVKKDFSVSIEGCSTIIKQGWQCNKTRLEKNRFLLLGFFGFFQMDFEKTRVFLGFFKFFGKKLTKTAKFEKKNENDGVFY